MSPAGLGCADLLCIPVWCRQGGRAPVARVYEFNFSGAVFLAEGLPAWRVRSKDLPSSFGGGGGEAGSLLFEVQVSLLF